MLAYGSIWDPALGFGERFKTFDLVAPGALQLDDRGSGAELAVDGELGVSTTLLNSESRIGKLHINSIDYMTQVDVIDAGT